MSLHNTITFNDCTSGFCIVHLADTSPSAGDMDYFQNRGL